MEQKTDFEKSLQNLRDRNDVNKVLQKDNKALVLTSHFSYDADYIQEIPTMIIQSSKKTFGMDVNRGDERLDKNIVLTFYKDCENVEKVFCMYASVYGVDPIAVMNTKDKIECENLHDVAEQIIEMSSKNNNTGTLDSLKDTMNLEYDKYEDSTNEDEGFTAFEF